MEACGAAGSVDHSRFQIVDDDGTRTAAKEHEGTDDAPIEFRLALRECELDIDHPAVAEHGHEDRDSAGRISYWDAAALAPVDLHGLGRLVVDFLVNATTRGTDRPHVSA